MEYCAHSENDQGKKHPLAKHLHETACLAESFAVREGYKPLFKLAGLLHDLGKYQPEFQNYLEHGGRRGSVPHAKWGAGYARKCKANDISIAIDGHHKGLPDRAAWQNDTNEIVNNDEPNYDAVKAAFVKDTCFDELVFSSFGKLPFDSFQRELFIRYLFSALTDSDWLSTEEHFNSDKFALRTTRILPIDFMLNRLEEEFAAKSKDGEINKLRNQVRLEAVSKATLPIGFYSLALPTGMGKTLTSLVWALNHAKTKDNQLKRIIIVLPYISIIDQTARELKRIFGAEWILEHHSSFNESNSLNTDKNEDYSTAQKRKQLACENWDYPVIVTTTVQFFESLFSNKPSKCRKIHNIAESVVIFDEVQTIPKEIILPTLGILNDVQAVMKTSFLFCTATQPAYEKRSGFNGITSITPLIEAPGILYDKTKRVTYHLLDELTPISFPRLQDTVIEHNEAALVIFNTKKDALGFFSLMKSGDLWNACYHLSTAMCPDHRKATIQRIRDDLQANRKILVVSTQLIEAGVDFDFPLVFRALAPLEAIIQSAGRCNREGLLNQYGKLGNVYLFLMEEARYPNKTYQACAGYAAELLQSDIEQLYSHNVFEKYYASVFGLYIDQTKQQAINDARNAFNFETVNNSYRYLDDHSEGLFIYNYNDESRQLLHNLQDKKFLSRDDYRAMQPFTVQAYANFIYQNGEDVKTSPHGFKIWYGNYDPASGISVAPMEVDKYVV